MGRHRGMICGWVGKEWVGGWLGRSVSRCREVGGWIDEEVDSRQVGR